VKDFLCNEYGYANAWMGHRVLPLSVVKHLTLYPTIWTMLADKEMLVRGHAGT
jgi:hypothetical protein